jgi:hypothetical protein
VRLGINDGALLLGVPGHMEDALSYRVRLDKAGIEARLKCTGQKALSRARSTNEDQQRPRRG